jgi:hypothetical protein
VRKSLGGKAGYIARVPGAGPLPHPPPKPPEVQWDPVAKVFKQAAASSGSAGEPSPAPSARPISPMPSPENTLVSVLQHRVVSQEIYEALGSRAGGILPSPRPPPDRPCVVWEGDAAGGIVADPVAEGKAFAKAKVLERNPWADLSDKSESNTFNSPWIGLAHVQTRKPGPQPAPAAASGIPEAQLGGREGSELLTWVCRQNPTFLDVQHENDWRETVQVLKEALIMYNETTDEERRRGHTRVVKDARSRINDLLEMSTGPQVLPAKAGRYDEDRLAMEKGMASQFLNQW